MGSTEVNSWITLAGILVTLVSIWSTWWLGRQDVSARRIQDVVSRFVEINTQRDSSVMAAPLKEFIAAGALALKQKEMETAAAMIVKAGFPSPFDSPDFKDGDVLRRAVAEGVDLDDWVSMMCFLAKES